MSTLFNKSKIAGIAVAIPKQSQDLMELDFDQTALRRIVKLTGIERTRIAPVNKTAADYSIAAAEKLFSDMQFDRQCIDGIVFVSAYPDYIQPGTCGVIQQRLGLGKNCVAMDINHACTAFVYGIFEAFLLVESGMCEHVLVCTGDTPTHYINERDRSMRMVSGDSGAAVVITRSASENPTSFSFYHDGSGIPALGILAGGSRQPVQKGITDVEEVDGNGNFHSKENLYMDGMEVMRFAMTQVRVQVEDILQKQGWKKCEVDIYGFHQANQFMLKNLIRQMNLDKDKVPIVLRDTGNLGPESIPNALCNCRGTSSQWAKAILCGFGSGLSCAAVGTDLRTTYFCSVREIV